jgi:hypothetical protein
MKTFLQFQEDSGSGYSKDYEQERIERRKKTPREKRQDKDLNRLTYMLNRDLPPPMYRSLF